MWNAQPRPQPAVDSGISNNNPDLRRGDMPLSDQTITARTIQGVSEWSSVPTNQITVAALLGDLRDNARTQLRGHNNAQFVTESGFPIPAAVWDDKQKDIKTVGDLRDFNKARNHDAPIV
jgi:hypothetical protein